MNAKYEELQKKKNEHIQKMTQLFEQKQNIDLADISNRMEDIDREMKEREERTNKEIERLKRENENALHQIKEQHKKDLENISKEKEEKINKIKEESKKRIEQNNLKINNLLDQFGYDIDQLINCNKNETFMPLSLLL